MEVDRKTHIQTKPAQTEQQALTIPNSIKGSGKRCLLVNLLLPVLCQLVADRSAYEVTVLLQLVKGLLDGLVDGLLYGLTHFINLIHAPA